MFEELCRTGRVHKLATIHRFRHRWEQRASLLLRAGNPDGLDAYLDHGRVTAGTFEQLVAGAARRWVAEAAAGRTVALVAETNAHVDALNAAVQASRRELGQIGERGVRIGGGETAAPGDVVVTRRNDRAIRTDRREPVRNRERWTVIGSGRDGSLTVSRMQGHGTVTLPPDYAREHVRLGYAATAHGHQGDTVDVGMMIATEATTHRSLYVGATRGRLENRFLVVTDDPTEVRDILEQVLSNERADVPAVAQRRNLARQVHSAEHRVAAAHQAVEDARRRAEPFLRPLRAAEAEVRHADEAVRTERRALEDAPRWRRRAVKESLGRAIDVASDARSHLAAAEDVARPYLARIDAAETDLRRAELDVRVARMTERLLQVAVERRAPGLDWGLEL
jgi:hypothetical protein